MEMSQYATTALAVIGALVFLVQLTVQLIKNLPGISKIPTDIVTIVLSIVYSEVALVVWSQITEAALEWYYYVGTFLGGLVVAYVAMFGWSKISELWKRSHKDSE